MAYTRVTTSHAGLVGIITKLNDNTYEWVLKERFTDATVDSKTGPHKGTLTIAGAAAADYDTAAADLKAAITAAG
tara:strand:+ start:284 stop:508 length:225 start_codon:yes stop_codon:yes gene_type:complete